MENKSTVLNKLYQYLNPEHLGVYILIGTLIWSLSFYLTKITPTKGVITTTGIAYQDVRADYAEIIIGIKATDQDRKQSYAKLLSNETMLKDYIKSKGISDNEISQSRYDTDPIYKTIDGFKNSDELIGYQSTALFRVATTAVDTIYQMTAELNTFVINSNITLYQNETSYLYTKLESLKINLLGKAMENAKERATAMGKINKSKIGGVINASQGTFQINRSNDYSVSDYGNLDTSSIGKTVRATVTVDFALK